MHERERWQAILDQIRQRAVMPVRELAEIVDASSATLRRDLTKLAEMGLLRRVHGAVEAVSPQERPQLATGPFDVARTVNGARKRAIARAAVDLCRDGESVIINGGSTTSRMIEFLRPRRLHILTNSFPVAEALVHHSENRIVVTGGEIYRDQNVIVSPFDDDSVQSYTASKMFMSGQSIGPLGVIEGDPLLARAEAKLLKRASDLIVLADSSKFEPRGHMTVAPLSRIHALITDDAAPASALAMLRDAGVQVIVVSVEDRLVDAA